MNEELISLKQLLITAEKILVPGSRLVIVTFHSLEDRIVKSFFNKISGKQSNQNRHLPEKKFFTRAEFKVLYKKPITANKEEISKNIRSRSAKLRALERIEN